MTNRPLILPYNGQVPHVPQGFTATPFATGLVNPRRLLVLPNGDVLLAEQSAGYLTLLRDTTATCWSRIRTASGGCRTSSVHCAPAALFVGIGSSGNLGVEPEPKASIQRFDADGSNQTTFASEIVRVRQ